MLGLFLFGGLIARQHRLVAQYRRKYHDGAIVDEAETFAEREKESWFLSLSQSVEITLMIAMAGFLSATCLCFVGPGHWRSERYVI